MDEKWNMADVLHASLILITYHVLCGLVFGQGLKSEVTKMLYIKIS